MKKKTFQDFCGKCINFCFFLGRFLSAHLVFNWANLCSTVCLLFRGWNNAPSYACREMSQRLTRASSNCRKSKIAWRSAGICHISNLKLAMKKPFSKGKTFFSSNTWNCKHTKKLFSHNKTFFFKSWNLLKEKLFENQSWQPVYENFWVSECLISWTCWLIIWVTAWSTNIILVLWLFEKNNPSKYCLGSWVPLFEYIP